MGPRKSYIHAVSSDRPLSSYSMPDIWELCLEHDAEETGHVTWCKPYERFNKRQLYDQAMLVAKGLLALGLKKGDSMCSFAVQGSDSAILFMACTSIGIIYMQPCCYAPVDKMVRNTINAIRPVLVVFGDARTFGGDAHVITEATCVLEDKDLHKVQFVLYDRLVEKDVEVYQPPSEWMSFNKLIEAGKSICDETLKKAKAVVDINERCYYYLSSGTTGAPKYILHGAASLTNIRAPQNDCRQKTVTSTTNAATNEHYGFLVDSYINLIDLVILPHEESNDDVEIATEILEALQRYRANMILCTPYHITTIVNKELHKDYDLSALQIIIIVGNLSSPDFKKKVAAIAPLSMNIYGCSEFLSACEAVPGIFETNPHAAGKVGCNVEAKVVDEDGVIVPLNTPGELYLRGYSRFIEYKDNPELTASVLTEDGWFKTGDSCSLGEDGMYYIHGRVSSSERFKVNDDVVYPAPIEAMLNKHPLVKDCVVVGTAAAGACGHEINYVIVPKTGADLTASQILNYAMENMSIEIYWPYRVFFWNELPRTKNSRRKILKKEVQKMVEDKIMTDKENGRVQYRGMTQ